MKRLSLIWIVSLWALTLSAESTPFGRGLFRYAQFGHSLYADMHPNFVRMDIPYCTNNEVRNKKPLNNAVARTSTPPGKSGSMRYVLEFAKKDAAYFYDLLVREGGPGRIRFDYIKIERM